MNGMTVNEETFKADKVKSLISLNVDFFSVIRYVISMGLKLFKTEIQSVSVVHNSDMRGLIILNYLFIVVEKFLHFNHCVQRQA